MGFSVYASRDSDTDLDMGFLRIRITRLGYRLGYGGFSVYASRDSDTDSDMGGFSVYASCTKTAAIIAHQPRDSDTDSDIHLFT